MARWLIRSKHNLNEGNMTTPSIPKIHHELEVFRGPGGLFDVEPCEMDLNIGRRGVFLLPACLVEQSAFTVVAVQKNYRGDKVYRVVPDTDVHKFGRCAAAEEIRFID
jgi:hypothetical protein